MKPQLILIPAPITDPGKPEQLPLEISNWISSIQHFLVENVRTARRYISSLQLGIDIQELSFEIIDKNTTPDQMKKLLQPMANGKNMGVISEAGCPGVADPGALAVEYAHKKGYEVVPLVGPSSILLALMASGMNGQKFCFHGYLPIEEEDRKKTLRKLEEESRKFNQTQIFIETPYRNNALLKSILEVCHPTARVCVARDITGDNNLVKTQTVAEWNGQLPELHKLPTVFLIHR